MDIEERQLLSEISRKLDVLTEIKTDLHQHILTDQLLFYGEDGKSGLVDDVNGLKQSRKLYNKLFAGIGTFMAGVVGETVRRIIK